MTAYCFPQDRTYERRGDGKCDEEQKRIERCVSREEGRLLARDADETEDLSGRENVAQSSKYHGPEGRRVVGYDCGTASGDSEWPTAHD